MKESIDSRADEAKAVDALRREAVQVSPDGNYWWNGTAWRPFQREIEGKRRPHAGWIIFAAIVLVVGVFIGFEWGASTVWTACQDAGGSYTVCRGMR